MVYAFCRGLEVKQKKLKINNNNIFINDKSIISNGVSLINRSELQFEDTKTYSDIFNIHDKRGYVSLYTKPKNWAEIKCTRTNSYAEY